MHRRRRLLLELPPPTNAVPREKIPVSTPELARLYARLSSKTLIRDLNWLIREELAIQSTAGYAANRHLMQAFEVPGAPAESETSPQADR